MMPSCTLRRDLTPWQGRAAANHDHQQRKQPTA